MIVEQAHSVSTISLERPASVRRLLPLASNQGWLLSEYIVGPENQTLRYLFDDKNVRLLGQLSPVVLYGEAQAGKTALAITLAVRWARLLSKRPLSFSNGKTFAAEFASALEIDDVDSFRQRHRQCKLLVIDDLEQIASAPATQVELVNTLDTLRESNQPIIVTASRLPANLPGLSPALASRLAAGFSVMLRAPGPATLPVVIRALVDMIDSSLPVDELVELAARFSAQPLSVPDLHRLVTLAKQNLDPTGAIDLDMLAQLSGQLFAGNGPNLPAIAKVVARRMHVRLTDMRAATREASVVRARGLAIFLARKLTASSLQQIGEYFGGRDHSTILHAFRKTSKLLDSDPELANLLQEIQAELLSRSVEN